MHTALVIPGIAVVSFVAGVVFSKAVLSDAAAIKEHVTAAEGRIRNDIASLLSKVAAKV